MKTLTLVVLICASSLANATPISHVFSGVVTYVSTDNIERYPSGDPSYYDWFPEVGDRYYGAMTFDRDQIVYANSISDCWTGDVCGGLTSFEIVLGERIMSLKRSAPPEVEVISDTNFSIWSQHLGNFDSFRFNKGSFNATDAAFWDGMSGEAEVWERVATPVPEPTPLVLCSLSLLVLGFRRYQLQVCK